MTRLAASAAVEYARTLRPGLLVTALVGMAAAFLGSHYNGSVRSFALLPGMAMHFISEERRCAARIQFALKDVTQFGWRPVDLSGYAGVGWIVQWPFDGHALIARTGEWR